MKRLGPAVALLVAVALVAAAACWITLRLVEREKHQPHDEAHAWIHAQLGLTAEQEQALAPIEERFDRQRRDAMESIRLANMELAEAILAEGKASPRVEAAMEKIHQAQGNLQQATLRHVFEMKPVLSAAQYQKLLNLTANALYEVDHAR